MLVQHTSDTEVPEMQNVDKKLTGPVLHRHKEDAHEAISRFELMLQSARRPDLAAIIKAQRARFAEGIERPTAPKKMTPEQILAMISAAQFAEVTTGIPVTGSLLHKLQNVQATKD